MFYLFFLQSAVCNVSSELGNGLGKIAWKSKPFSPEDVIPGVGAETQEQLLIQG